MKKTRQQFGYESTHILRKKPVSMDFMANAMAAQSGVTTERLSFKFTFVIFVKCMYTDFACISIRRLFI